MLLRAFPAYHVMLLHTEVWMVGIKVKQAKIEQID